MKKNAIRKMKLNRETIRALGDTESQKALGGGMCSSNAPTGPAQACAGTNACTAGSNTPGCQIGGTVGGTVGGTIASGAGC